MIWTVYLFFFLASNPVGNRLKQIINGDTTTYTYDDANRLEQATHQSTVVSYQFDDNGNLLKTGVLTNAFDAANRLTSTVRGETTPILPKYNGLNDRLAQTVGATTTHFALDGAGGLPEVISTTNGTAYLHLPGVIVAQNAAGERVYLLSDGLGSVRQVISGTTVISQHDFDPYGNPTSSPQPPTPYGFTGEWWEQDVGLLHLRARWYAPETGTFLSHDLWSGDPLRSQTFNPYSYVGGNPVNSADPSGRCYPPIEFLRSVEGVVCANLDQAIFIYAHPYSSGWQVAAASAYISTWTVSHSALVVGGGIVAGSGLYAGAGAVATWGLGYLTAHPTVATIATAGSVAASFVDDATTLYGAVTGNPDDMREAIIAQQMGAADGQLPFADTIAAARFFSQRACNPVPDLLETFVNERLGKAPQDINCYGCVLKEWPETQGNPAIIDDLRPNPWGSDFDSRFNFIENHPNGDLIENAIRSNFDSIDPADLSRGDLISWSNTQSVNFGFGHGPQDYQFTTHVGIYLGDNKVFGKMGYAGAYEIRSLDDSVLALYGTMSYWRAR